MAIYGCMALIIWFGTNLVFAGELSVGGISTFLLYMMTLIINFAILALVVGNVSKVAGASSRVITMMQQIPAVNSRGGIIIPEYEIIGEIELKNICFSYPTKKDVDVAKNISLKVEKNKVLALVG